MAIVTVACHGNNSGGSSSGGTCTLLNANDLQRVAGVRPARVESLAHAPGIDFTCASLFIDGSGQLILEVMESPGKAPTLAGLRRRVAAEQGRTSPVPGLGAGAFVACRELAFLHD